MINTVPSTEFVIVSSLLKVTPEPPDTSTDEKIAVPGEFAPIVAPSIAPPFMSTPGNTVVPVNVTLPLVKVIRSRSSVCPIVVPFVVILSTVKVVKVPRDVTFP